MTTGYDAHGLVPANICPDCGQPSPGHLPICPQLGVPQPASSPPVTPETAAAVEEEQKHLGEAV